MIAYVDLRLYIIEGIFLLDFIFQFFLEYEVTDKPEPVRDLSKTAMRYFKNEMG